MITTNFFIRQATTASDSPILFACSDGKSYWVKDKRGGQRTRALINEWFAASLARQLGIPVPDWAEVEIIDGSFDPTIIEPQGRHLTLGSSFGSKGIENVFEVSEHIPDFGSRKFFKQLTKPEDLIRIAVFDLWIANGDRNRNNYNLLLKREKKQLHLIAIDHTFLFEDLAYEHILDEQNEFSDDVGSLYGTTFFKKISAQCGRNKVDQIIEQFIQEIESVTKSQLQTLLDSVPNDWTLMKNHKNFITQFLRNRTQPLQKFLKQNIFI